MLTNIVAWNVNNSNLVNCVTVLTAEWLSHWQPLSFWFYSPLVLNQCHASTIFPCRNKCLLGMMKLKKCSALEWDRGLASALEKPPPDAADDRPSESEQTTMTHVPPPVSQKATTDPLRQMPRSESDSDLLISQSAPLKAFNQPLIFPFKAEGFLLSWVLYVAPLPARAFVKQK